MGFKEKLGKFAGEALMTVLKYDAEQVKRNGGSCSNCKHCKSDVCDITHKKTSEVKELMGTKACFRWENKY